MRLAIRSGPVQVRGWHRHASMTAALRRALDHLRHGKTATAAGAAIGEDLRTSGADRAPDVADPVAAIQADPSGDDLLRLISCACHPVLAREARVALALRLVCGLTTHEIARAFLVTEPSVAQRIVRARRRLRDAAALSGNERERLLLSGRAAACGGDLRGSAEPTPP